MQRIQVIAAALALAAAPLAAQEPAHPAHPAQGQEREKMMDHMMPMMREMMGPMMRVMAFTPDNLLERRDVLALTPQQVTRLTALRDAAKTAHDAAQADAKTHHDALAQAMAAPAPDTTAVRQHFLAAHAAMGNAHWAMLRASAQAKAVLTEAQRGRVEGWADAMEKHDH
jgi:Spy/CpxP family protein refolding chaperone